MIVFRSPKGWTGPEDRRRAAHRGDVAFPSGAVGDVQTNPDHLALLESWMRSYRPEELFDEKGALVTELAALPPKDDRRMSANPHANGGLLLRDLVLPDFQAYAVPVDKPGTTLSEATKVLGGFLRDVMSQNPSQFRLFGPDEVASNRLQAVFDVTDRQWEAERLSTDDHLAPEGRVMEVLSEHQCEGWLEGYLLTGRHGLFTSYEAFIHIVDSMFNQHAKWLKYNQPHTLAPSRRFAQLPVVVTRVAPGPQRFLASGSRVHRPRRQQKGRSHQGVLTAGHQLPTLRG